MRSLIVLNPAVPVAGHPIEILEVGRDPASFLWSVKLRITTATGSVETRQRYDTGKRVTIDTVPESDEAYRLLLASRGATPWAGNPLSDAIESIDAANP